MSKDLIDADDFTSPIHVPEGIDARDHAAEDVELVAQRLANRTLYLRSRVDPLVDDAARKSADNRFLGSNSFDHALIGLTGNAEEALLKSDQSPADLGSEWRLVSSFRHSVAAAGIYRYAQIYVGSNASDINGSLVIVVNAVWDKAAAVWRQQYTGTGTVALIWHRDRLRVSRVKAGAAPWTAWPTGFVVGTGSGGTIVDASIEGDYNYLTARARTVQVPLFAVFGASLYQSLTTGFLQVKDAFATMAWPLRVPAGTVLVQTDLIVNQTTATNGTLTLYEVTPSYSSPFAVARTPISAVTASFGASLHLVSASWGNRTVKADSYYEVNWLPGALADDVRGIQLMLTDPGPRNF